MDVSAGHISKVPNITRCGRWCQSQAPPPSDDRFAVQAIGHADPSRSTWRIEYANEILNNHNLLSQSQTRIPQYSITELCQWIRSRLLSDATTTRFLLQLYGCLWEYFNLRPKQDKIKVTDKERYNRGGERAIISITLTSMDKSEAVPRCYAQVALKSVVRILSCDARIA